MFGTDCPASQLVIGQGGVVYDAPAAAVHFFSHGPAQLMS